jgi:hypothetical protein
VVIGVDIYFIARAKRPGAAPAAETQQVPAQAATSAALVTDPSDDGTAPAVSAPTASPSNDVGADPSLFEDDFEQSDQKLNPRPSVRIVSVHDAAVRSCNTDSVEKLSRQLIEQSRCLDSARLTALPTRPNLVLGAQVFGYLDRSARDHLLRVLDTHKNRTMKVNSVLRTIAQQYLVWRWSAGKRCGVQLASQPGESDHELGLALDIADENLWRPALEKEGFHWFGNQDKVHFNYESASIQKKLGADVRAFQLLWNRNHPDDRIAEDGHYDAATERRLEQAPADGFPIGPRCKNSKPRAGHSG